MQITDNIHALKIPLHIQVALGKALECFVYSLGNIAVNQKSVVLYPGTHETESA